MKMIKLSYRRNLIYLLLLFISYLLRRIIGIIIGKIYDLGNSLIFVFIMFLAEFMGGLLVYVYQTSFLNRNKNVKTNTIYKLIIKKQKLKQKDNWFKIILLIFFCSFFDINEFILLTNILPKNAELSSTASLRLCCIITITSAIICRYTLRFKILKHQKFSLTIMGICSIIIIIFELIYKPKEINFGIFLLSYLLIICHYILISFMDVTEKYLVDYDYLNPLLILMLEGLFGLALLLLYIFIYDNPFIEMIDIYNKIDTRDFIILIFLLILYCIFSAGINIYRILCNVLYSPMTKSLASYFLNWVHIIYYFVGENDFVIDGKRKYFLFVVNIILSVFIDFLGFIYNEIILLNFSGLAESTHLGISKRAKLVDIEMVSIKEEEENDDLYFTENEQTN